MFDLEGHCAPHRNDLFSPVVHFASDGLLAPEIRSMA